jgi:hypothetical protein
MDLNNRGKRTLFLDKNPDVAILVGFFAIETPDKTDIEAFLQGAPVFQSVWFAARKQNHAGPYHVGDDAFTNVEKQAEMKNHYERSPEMVQLQIPQDVEIRRQILAWSRVEF